MICENASDGFGTATSAACNESPAISAEIATGTSTTPARVERKAGRYFSLPKKLRSSGPALSSDSHPVKTRPGWPASNVAPSAAVSSETVTA